MHRLETVGLVAGIFDPAPASCAQRRAQASPREPKQRPHERNALPACRIEGAARRHAGQAVQPATTTQTHQQRLGLIVFGVGGDDRARSSYRQRNSKLLEQPIASRASGVLHTCQRLGAIPGKQRRVQAGRARLGDNPLRLIARAIAQTVVDGCDADVRSIGILPGPSMSQVHQSHAVGTAGNSKDQSLKVRERCEKRLKLVVLNRQLIGPGRIARRPRRSIVSCSQYACARTSRGS